MQRNILEADSIIVNYGTVTVLSNVYIKCEQGQIVGLLGRNGSGKSTLFNVIFGALEPDQKSVRINGEYVTKGYRYSRIRMLPQSGLIPSGMKIRDALKLFDLTPDIIKESQPEIADFLDETPGNFSGGELKFLELLMILHAKSEFCLLDEPFSGLSPVMIERAIAVMKKARERKGILVTDHLYRHVIDCSDRLYCMTSRRTIPVTDTEQLAFYGYLGQ
jgi:lipopolysaccharide export system ATP-binding protein